MTTRSKIVGLTRQTSNDHATDTSGIPLDTVEPVDTGISAEPEAAAEYGESDAVYDSGTYEQYDGGNRWARAVVPTLLVAVLLAWTGFFAWTHLAEAQYGMGGKRAAELIATWAAPVLLVGVLWLIAMRNSTREARRFGDVARMLRGESDALAERMRTVNEEISLAREFLAQNARELESVGRQSSRQLLDAAEQLGVALADSDLKAKTLEAVSSAATSNLEQLRKHLPVVTGAAKDVTNQIGSAGNNAQVQIKSLIAALERVGEAGKSARDYIDTMEIRADDLSSKLEQSVSDSASFLEQKNAEAMAQTTEMATLIGHSAENLSNSVASATAEVDRMAVESNEKIMVQLGSLRAAIAELSGYSQGEEQRINAIIGEIEGHIETSANRIGEIDRMATDQTAKLAFAVSALGESTKNVGDALNDNRQNTEQLIARSEQLLAGLETANREMAESLPAAMAQMDERFTQSVAKLDAAAAAAGTLDQLSDDLLAKLQSLEHLVGVQRGSVEKMMAESDENFTGRHEQAEALSALLTQTRALIDDVSAQADDRLIASLLRVRDTTREAAESSRAIVEGELAGVADRLTEQNRFALATAVDDQIAHMNEMMQGSIERNLQLSEAATSRLTAQIGQLNEMADNLEARLAESRESFDGVDDDSFARRMVLLTESLNSTAIDVAKIMSNEVTDTAWAAYLKGDRGVFTRRAVRLLDAGEARTIAAYYSDDSEFREHVNRYIHDFESMMRALLSTRDGNAICVTLLSSDVGKLYVALAQAIERLRS